jgi:hypothetical protein
MGSEPSFSTTPILDQIKPLPSRETSVIALLVGFILALPLGAALNYALTTRQGNGLLLILPVFFVIVTIHEFGHAIAGQLVGFRLQGMTIGPVCVSNEFGRWTFRMRRLQDAFGLTAMSIDRVRRVRVRFAWMVLAGPLANLLTAALALLLDRLAQTDENSGIHELILLFVVLSAWIGLSSLVPMKSSTYSSDGRRLQMLLCSPANCRRFVILAAIDAAARRISAKKWNQRWILAAVSISDNSFDCFHANWYAYLSASTRNQEQLAAYHLERCLSLAGCCGRRMKEMLPLEAAVFSAWHLRDADKAKAWMNQVVKKQYWPKIIDLRARIAMFCVDNRFDEATALWNEGLAYVQGLPANPHREVLEAAWHEWLTKIEERRTSKALSTVTSG